MSNRSKRIVIYAICAVVGAAIFAGLVHATLVAAKVSEPAATTVQGLTLRRLWATSAALIATVSVVGGALAGARRNRGFGLGAMAAGAIAAANGVANLALANGGPGSGNGVVGAAAAVVLGVAGASLGAWAVMRARGKAGHFYPIQDSHPPVG